MNQQPPLAMRGYMSPGSVWTGVCVCAAARVWARTRVGTVEAKHRHSTPFVTPRGTERSLPFGRGPRQRVDIPQTRGREDPAERAQSHTKAPIRPLRQCEMRRAAQSSPAPVRTQCRREARGMRRCGTLRGGGGGSAGEIFASPKFWCLGYSCGVLDSQKNGFCGWLFDGGSGKGSRAGGRRPGGLLACDGLIGSPLAGVHVTKSVPSVVTCHTVSKGLAWVAQKISWGHFRHQSENRNFPLQNPPPPYGKGGGGGALFRGKGCAPPGLATVLPAHLPQCQTQNPVFRGSIGAWKGRRRQDPHPP